MKLRFDCSATPKWDIGANLTYRSSFFARGDENNEDVNGKLAGYLLIDLDTTYRVTKQLEVFTRVTKPARQRLRKLRRARTELLYRSENHTFNGANPVNEQFVGVGAPRGVWAGLRYARD